MLQGSMLQGSVLQGSMMQGSVTVGLKSRERDVCKPEGHEERTHVVLVWACIYTYAQERRERKSARASRRRKGEERERPPTKGGREGGRANSVHGSGMVCCGC